MDEFKDIDAELMRLKEELFSKDDLTRQVKFSASGDYWKSRLDEERVLWDKKAALGGEERKALEKKLQEQDDMLSRYNQSVKEMERKLENDTKLWEERLRLKEADILIEKNRLQCESRVKEIEIERQKLLERVTELSGKITEIRDEQVIEIEKLKQHSRHDADNYEEKLKISAAQALELQLKITEIENSLKNRITELEALKDEYKLRLDKAESKVQEEYQAKLALERQISDVTAHNEAEKTRIKTDFAGNALKLGDSLNKHLGILSGFAGLAAEKRLNRKAFEILKDLTGKAQLSAEVFGREINVRYNVNDNFKTALLMSDEDTAYWEAAVSGTKIALHKIGLKQNYKKEIKSKKPCICVVSSNIIGAAKTIKDKWPFIPILIYGEVSKTALPGLQKSGFIIMPPYTTADAMILAACEAAKTSLAQPEYWDKIKIIKSRYKYVVAAAAMLLVCAGFYIKNNTNLLEKLGKVSSYSVPYNQPSNITFDGEYLWACDWYGQSIYKHDTGSGLKLLKIFCFPGKHFTAITWAGGYLWSADAWDNKIYKHNIDDNFTVLAEYPAPGASISGLAFDGKNLWSCDSSAGMIYRHTIDGNLTVEDVFESPGASPSGLFYDGKNLWSVDSKINKIFRHKMDNTLSVDASYMPPLFDQKNYSLSGIAIKGNKFWLCSEKLGKVFSFPKEKMEEVK